MKEDDLFLVSLTKDEVEKNCTRTLSTEQFHFLMQWWNYDTSLGKRSHSQCGPSIIEDSDGTRSIKVLHISLPPVETCTAQTDFLPGEHDESEISKVEKSSSEEWLRCISCQYFMWFQKQHVMKDEHVLIFQQSCLSTCKFSIKGKCLKPAGAAEEAFVCLATLASHHNSQLHQPQTISSFLFDHFNQTKHSQQHFREILCNFHTFRQQWRHKNVSSASATLQSSKKPHLR